ncbi:MAG: glycoside hydrolase family 88 protein [Candidatus Glassbacteria bacterium]|nr:glycoside hydrolase family 88 protein [Candidatus Glassbacteria bacterium]
MKKIHKTAGLTAGLFAGLFLLAVSGCGLLGERLTRLETSTGVRYAEVLSYAGSQVDAAYSELNGGYPVYTDNGDWSTTEKAAWAYGYYPGMAWLVYQSTRDPKYYELAQIWTKGLEGRSEDTSGNGLGQVFFPTHVVGYQVTGNRHFREVALQAAGSLSDRFNRAGFIPAWGAPGDTILGRRLSIETMMDLDLLYWATEATGNQDFAMRANTHSLFTLTNLVNVEGKVLHMADFHPDTGRPFLEKNPVLTGDKTYSPKGYEPGTAWAMGQAWAIYGFTSCYRRSGKTLFLNTARRAADYFLANLPEDGVSFWDFDLPPGERKQKDTSATAVAAAALLKLSRLCPSESDRLRYRAAAEKMIGTLTHDFLKRDGLGGLLSQGIYDKNQGLGVGGSTAWGDYYYIEALLILKDYKA